MKRTTILSALAVAMLLPCSPAMANEAAEQAKAMLAKAEEMRAEAAAIEAKAQEMLAAAEEAAAAATESVAAAAEPAAAEPAAEAESAAGEELSGAEGDNIAAAYEEGGKYFTADDIPTFNVKEDGSVDWYIFSGFRRYHAECHVCHGPDGEGSTYAPALKDSAINMDYYDFYDVVVNGRKKIGASENSVMPAFGENPNVMCYLDDIYIYLKAHGSGAIARGRPPKKERKSEAYKEAENACMGS